MAEGKMEQAIQNYVGVVLICVSIFLDDKCSSCSIRRWDVRDAQLRKRRDALRRRTGNPARRDVSPRWGLLHLPYRSIGRGQEHALAAHVPRGTSDARPHHAVWTR